MSQTPKHSRPELRLGDLTRAINLSRGVINGTGTTEPIFPAAATQKVAEIIQKNTNMSTSSIEGESIQAPPTCTRCGRPISECGLECADSAEAHKRTDATSSGAEDARDEIPLDEPEPDFKANLKREPAPSPEMLSPRPSSPSHKPDHSTILKKRASMAEEVRTPGGDADIVSDLSPLPEAQVYELWRRVDAAFPGATTMPRRGIRASKLVAPVLDIWWRPLSTVLYIGVAVLGVAILTAVIIEQQSSGWPVWGTVFWSGNTLCWLTWLSFYWPLLRHAQLKEVHLTAADVESGKLVDDAIILLPFGSESWATIEKTLEHALAYAPYRTAKRVIFTLCYDDRLPASTPEQEHGTAPLAWKQAQMLANIDQCLAARTTNSERFLNITSVGRADMCGWRFGRHLVLLVARHKYQKRVNGFKAANLNAGLCGTIMVDMLVPQVPPVSLGSGVVLIVDSRHRLRPGAVDGMVGAMCSMPPEVREWLVYLQAPQYFPTEPALSPVQRNNPLFFWLYQPALNITGLVANSGTNCLYSLDATLRSYLAGQRSGAYGEFSGFLEVWPEASTVEDHEQSQRAHPAGFVSLSWPYIIADGESSATVTAQLRAFSRWDGGNLYNGLRFFGRIMLSRNLTLGQKLRKNHMGLYLLQSLPHLVVWVGVMAYIAVTKRYIGSLSIITPIVISLGLVSMCLAHIAVMLELPVGTGTDKTERLSIVDVFITFTAGTAQLLRSSSALFWFRQLGSAKVAGWPVSGAGGHGDGQTVIAQDSVLLQQFLQVCVLMFAVANAILDLSTSGINGGLLLLHIPKLVLGSALVAASSFLSYRVAKDKYGQAFRIRTLVFMLALLLGVIFVYVLV